jgi:hypothetical protein
VPIVLKSRSLNLLEPSGPVLACNGIAFLPCIKEIPMMMIKMIKIIIILYRREDIKLLDDWVNDIFPHEKHPF